jgi:hypothetical protein
VHVLREGRVMATRSPSRWVPARPARSGRRPYGERHFDRSRKQRAMAELLGRLIDHHGLTDEVRQRFVCLYWTEIAGERFAPKTFPIGFSSGVLQVSTATSSWVHEMQFFKAQLIDRINGWVDANRVWLGPPPLVKDIRFMLAPRNREPLVDREQVRRLRVQRAPRVEAAPPSATDREREAIQEETSAILDPEVRAAIEAVRLKWNR